MLERSWRAAVYQTAHTLPILPSGSFVFQRFQDCEGCRKKRFCRFSGLRRFSDRFQIRLRDGISRISILSAPAVLTRANKGNVPMKRAWFSVLTVVVLVGLCGCVTQHGRRPWACMGGSCAQAPENCQACEDGEGAPCEEGMTVCDKGGCRLRKHCPICNRQPKMAQEPLPAGPATGAIAYPYYTNRGPRDFLAKDPASIGP